MLHQLPTTVRRRRKGKTQDRELRSLARAGRWAEVRQLLEERLMRDPKDEEARAELDRLLRGIPLRVLETALMRKQREEQEMRHELAAELRLFRDTPGQIDEWKPAVLVKRRKRIALIRTTLGNRLPSEMADETARYLKALAARQEQHRGKHQWLRLIGIGLPLLALIGGLTYAALDARASKAEAALRAALAERDTARVATAVTAADSGIHRLVSKRLGILVDQARFWMLRRERERQKLSEQIARLENGEGSVSSLSLGRRVEIERELRQLPREMTELRARWHRLCEREQGELDRQRAEVEQRFLVPLPPMPELTNAPAEDQAQLLAHQKLVAEQLKECEAACELFGLNDSLAAPMRERLHKLCQLLADISAMRRTTALLTNARTYNQYRKMLEANKPQVYEPALRMMEIRDRLPDEDKLRDQMQDHGRKLPPGMLEAARTALLKKGPSFTPAFHANARQVRVMEDVFTATTLQKTLYQISTPGQPVYIIEERPDVGEESVRFTPSPLTPGYSLSTPKSVTWGNPSAVWLRTIDATPLSKIPGLTRRDFFRSSNLPHLLDCLLHLDAPYCPALARAYLFNRLLEVMHAHEWPTMLGIAYAPTLRADARSFRKLVKASGLNFDAGCWLLATPEATRAEEAFGKWFHERRFHSYAKEIANNFGALVQVHPRYVGFIDEKGQPRLYRHLSGNSLLWYMAEGGLTTTPREVEPESPTLFSPIFVVERD